VSDRIGAIQRQPKNINWLIPTNFRMVINKFVEVPFFVQEWTMPSIGIGSAKQSNPFTDIPIPGDKVIFSDLNITFLINEDLSNWIEIQRWIFGMGFPENFDQYYDLSKSHTDNLNVYSDITMVMLDNENRPKLGIKFIDAFPVDLSGWSFDTRATDAVPITSTVTFKYTRFEFENV